MDHELETDYREFLRRELTRRVQRNPAYSLRAFARDIRVSPSTLSEALRGRFDFSAPQAADFACRFKPAAGDPLSF